MIEKLENSEQSIYDSNQNFIGTMPTLSSGALLGKINELVDAVNKLQESQNTYWTDIAEIKKELQTRPENVHPDAESRSENVQDKFAEQRRWIGKLCRFWNFKDGAVDIGILKAVDNLQTTLPYINDIDCSYAFCEPVKPDDDIIYKGE